jgi:hypothetical protein
LDNAQPDWSSDLDEVLQEFESFAKEDGYQNALEPSLAQVKKALLAARKEQLQSDKAQIMEALEIEIIGLFGYERSQAAYTALASEEVAKAREILQSPQKYAEILSAPKAP